MERIGQLLMNLGSNAAPVILLLAELLLAVILLAGFVRLAAKRRRGKEKSRGKAAYYDMIQEASGSAHIVVRRSDDCPVFVSDNFEKILGISRESVLSDLELLRSKIGWRRFSQKYNAWDGRSRLTWEFVLADSDGRKGNVDFRMSVNRSKDERYELFSFVDISEEKLRVSQIEKKLKEEEEASESKTAFLSKMSHEIRTPMNGIIGMTNLAMARLEPSHPAYAYLTKSEEASGYLLSLINDILDMSRIEAGKMELEKKEFDIYALGDNLRNMFQKNVEAKGVKFFVDYYDFDVRYLIGDELRISQVVINLLSNAVKFTEKGEIRVTFRQMYRKGDMIKLMIRVNDTGKGMESDFISRIFRPFEQETVSVAKKYGGSGLGMAIVDQIVRLMGGEIVIDSIPGKGSDFKIFISLSVAKDQERERDVKTEVSVEETEEFSYEGRRILLAEDNELNAEIAVGVLEMEGADVEVAANGQEAVEKFVSHPAGYYDFILMDIQMPVMDGRSAARMIRSMDREDAKDILIFALSADAFVEDQRLSREIGMNGHFAKPINFDEMRVEIGKIVKERECV